MASLQPGIDDYHANLRLPPRARRLLILFLIGVALLLWGQRSFKMLARGWSTSVRVLQCERELELRRQRVELLKKQVAYAATEEGRDLEAKRQFGVGPRDEIWITVEVQEPPPSSPPPRSISERVETWLSSVGSAITNRVRFVVTVFSYWTGFYDVSDYQPGACEAAADRTGADEDAATKPAAEAEDEHPTDGVDAQQ